MIKLRSIDGGEEFTVSLQNVRCSTLLRDMLENIDLDQNEPIVLPNVSPQVLKTVVDYMNTTFDKELFCSNMSYPFLIEVILAANYLHIQSLLDLGCKTIADVFKGKTLEEARQAFNITTELSAEEIERIRIENPWCVDEKDTVD